LNSWGSISYMLHDGQLNRQVVILWYAVVQRFNILQLIGSYKTKSLRHSIAKSIIFRSGVVNDCVLTESAAEQSLCCNVSMTRLKSNNGFLRS